jgi:DNA-binding NarL/FixJ family response regulator
MDIDLKKLSILLVSSKTTHRAGLRKMLCDMGADNHFIEIAADYTQASERLSKSPMNILISDDDVSEKYSALDLIPLHAANNENSRDRLFILMSGDQDPFLVSQFILKGGDLIIEKPFTNDVFAKALRKILKLKQSLSADEGLALDIQDALKAKDFKKAKESFSFFEDQHSQAALFSKALIYESDLDYERAFKTYAQAIEMKMDLKTLVNLVHTGVRSKNFSETGEYVEAWVKDFPIHNESVPDITRVVVFNKKFDLLDDLSETCSKTGFTDLFVRTSLAAGLIVAASDYLENQDEERAIDYALKGIDFSGFKTSILLRGLDILVRADAQEEAEKIFKMLNSKAPYSDNPILNIQMQEVIYPKSVVLESCMNLISKNIIDEDIFQVALNCLKSLGKDTSELLLKAKRAYPLRNFI